jgi:secreted PhoX family phosphatase
MLDHVSLSVTDPARSQAFYTQALEPLGPKGLEITGTIITPDMRTMFINVQHPGEAPLPHPGRNDPKNPKGISSWPDGDKGGRPRSATIAIRRRDGGIIGT